MPFNPFEEKPIPIEMTYMDWKTMYPKPYNKETADPYTKCRVVLMNGTEFEAQWFSRNFSRHCPDNDLRRSLAMMRRTEQQQQKRISCLKPKDETILEHTITYEQLAVDLTARLAQKETDCNVRNTMNFALLEDFDHLYRYSNLLEMEYNRDAKKLVGGYTEIMPARPTIAEHRCPKDSINPYIINKKTSTLTQLQINIIMAAEQQTMNYYMNVAPLYCKSDLGRRLYQEIGMIEEQHVSEYESLKDTKVTWLEDLLMHEYTECYLYYSCMQTECDPYIRCIWENCLTQEICHLHMAKDMLRKYEHRDWQQIIPCGAFPELLVLGPNIEYVRRMMSKTTGNTRQEEDIVSLNSLKKGNEFFVYQQIVNHDVCSVPSHNIIDKHICSFGKDYRYQTAEHPVALLRSRTCDNVTLARIPCETPEKLSVAGKTSDCDKSENLCDCGCS